MKSCPACHRQYADDSLRFCLEDGTALPQVNNLPETLRFETRHTDPVPQPARRVAVWPFALAGIGLLGLLFILIAGAFFYMKSIDRAQVATPTTAGPEKTVRIASDPVARPQSRSDVEQELERVNNEIGNALILGDLVNIEHLLADDYRFVSDAGITLTKDDLLMLYRTGNIGYEYMTNSDLKIEVSSDFNKGVVSGRSRAKGQFRRQRFTDSAFFSNTYEKRQDRWQLISGVVRHR